jgi:hypothetical protein
MIAELALKLTLRGTPIMCVISSYKSSTRNASGILILSPRLNHQRAAEEEHGGDGQDTAQAGGGEGTQRLRGIIGVLSLGGLRALGLVAEQLLELGLIGWVGVDRGGVVAGRGRVRGATDKVCGNALRRGKIQSQLINVEQQKGGRILTLKSLPSSARDTTLMMPLRPAQSSGKVTWGMQKSPRPLWTVMG